LCRPVKIAGGREPDRLVVRPLVPLSDADEAAVLEEATSLASFLATAKPGRPAPVVRRFGES